MTVLFKKYKHLASNDEERRLDYCYWLQGECDFFFYEKHAERFLEFRFSLPINLRNKICPSCKVKLIAAIVLLQDIIQKLSKRNFSWKGTGTTAQEFRMNYGMKFKKIIKMKMF